MKLALEHTAVLWKTKQFKEKLQSETGQRTCDYGDKA